MTSEISDLLIDVPDGIFIDATYGYGSHFKYFKKNHNNIDFLALDRDLEAVNNSPDTHNVQHYSFSKINEYLENNNIIDYLYSHLLILYYLISNEKL